MLIASRSGTGARLHTTRRSFTSPTWSARVCGTCLTCVSSPIYRRQQTNARLEHHHSGHYSTLSLSIPSFSSATSSSRTQFEPVAAVPKAVAVAVHSNGGPMATFLDLVHSAQLESDPHQIETMSKLQNLFERFEAHRKDGSSSSSSAALFPLKGLYMYGGVGTGKTMMMDLFFESITHTNRKKRIHFHAFMADVHQRIHNMRQINGSRDVMPDLIAQLASESSLLCFDEFQVTDVADAMILKRLFEGLFQAGVVVVATSNRPPNDLYKGGLNRELFLPFIELLKRQCNVHHMKAQNDYRLTGSRTSSVYFSPLDAQSSSALDQVFSMLTEGHEAASTEVMVLGREVQVPLAAKGVARFSFADLCDQPLAAVDYMAIAKEFHTIILSDIPYLSWNERDKLRRFITLIDVLYEYKVKVIISAAAPAQQLFVPADSPSSSVSNSSGSAPSSVHIPVDTTTRVENSDEHFAFDRTVSRLMEMQTTQYLQQQHTVLVGEQHAHSHQKLHHHHHHHHHHHQ